MQFVKLKGFPIHISRGPTGEFGSFIQTDNSCNHFHILFCICSLLYENTIFWSPVKNRRDLYKQVCSFVRNGISQKPPFLAKQMLKSVLKTPFLPCFCRFWDFEKKHSKEFFKNLPKCGKNYIYYIDIFFIIKIIWLF